MIQKTYNFKKRQMHQDAVFQRAHAYKLNRKEFPFCLTAGEKITSPQIVINSLLKIAGLYQTRHILILSYHATFARVGQNSNPLVTFRLSFRARKPYVLMINWNTFFVFFLELIVSMVSLVFMSFLAYLKKGPILNQTLVHALCIQLTIWKMFLQAQLFALLLH